MAAALVLAGLAALVGVVAWRPHGWGPAAAATLAVALVFAGGGAGGDDLVEAVTAQWRAFVTLASVMMVTSTAEALGLLERLAAIIEPRTRGPVRNAFRVTFVLAALVAAVLSNDAAVLILMPTVIALLRAVYPRRHPKFVVPFAFAVLTAAGVAPFVVSNPMNLIFAHHMHVGFNRYALIMVPVAVVAAVVTYLVLVRVFREALADEAPALGAWPHRRAPLTAGQRTVLVAVVVMLGGYPLLAAFELPLWPVAAGAGLVCAAVSVAGGRSVRAVALGVSWGVFPFLVGVFVLAVGLARVGVVGWLSGLYAATPLDVEVVGATSAVGSALLNNHPMSVLNAFALEHVPAREPGVFAAMVGGDLGPRLLPVGSLAALLWYDLLRKHGVTVRVTTFIRVGVILTLPTLLAAVVTLRLVLLLAP